MANPALVGTVGVFKSASDTGSTPQVVTLPAGNAGDCAYVLCANYANAFTSVVGSVNGAYTKNIDQFDSSSNDTEIWSRPNASASTETVTLTPAGSVDNYISAVACRFSDIATTTPLDKTGTVSNSKTVTASAANADAVGVSLIMAVAESGVSNNGFGPPSGYTTLALENASDTYTGFIACYKVYTSTETSGGTLTASSTAVDQALATYKGVAAAGVNGTASITLAGATVAATGTVALKGTAAVTLAAATAVATGVLPIVGTASVTVAGATLAATGVLPIVGTSSVALAGATVVATGVLPIAGAAAITLDEATVSATGVGVISTTGTLVATLDGVSAVGTGELGPSPVSETYSGGFLVDQFRSRARGAHEKHKRGEAEERERQEQLARLERQQALKPELTRADRKALKALNHLRAMLALQTGDSTREIQQLLQAGMLNPDTLPMLSANLSDDEEDVMILLQAIL